LEKKEEKKFLFVEKKKKTLAGARNKEERTLEIVKVEPEVVKMRTKYKGWGTGFHQEDKGKLGMKGFGRSSGSQVPSKNAFIIEQLKEEKV